MNLPKPCMLPTAQFHNGDWLNVIRQIEHATIDLLYVDPPYNTGLPKRSAENSFEDSWPDTASYIRWISDRIEASLPALKPSANLLIHLDWRTSHRVRLLLDDLLGEDRFVNHLVWSYALGGSSPRRFARKHDDILYYCLDPDLYWFEPPQVPATSRRMAGLTKKATDVLPIPSINNMARERVGWPTQKPLALLDILVRACCPPNGTILDPCCGSGTTIVSALRAGRSAIGIDASSDAIRISRQRLRDLFPSTADFLQTASLDEHTMISQDSRADRPEIPR